MDFEFTSGQTAFRQEIRDFLKKELPAGYNNGDVETPEGRAEIREFHRKLGAKGWLVMAWPKEYGGGGASFIEQLIFNEEYGYHRAPYLGPGVNFIGPSLIIHGTEEQR